MAQDPLPASQKALIVSKTGHDAHMQIEDIEIPKPGPEEILIQLIYTGVCHADVAFVFGEWDQLGFRMVDSQTPGHEGVGRVVAVGANVDAFKVGDKVGTKWTRSVCGNCSFCRRGKVNVCSRQVTYGRNSPGSFQQYVTSPANYTPRVPDSIPDETAGPLLCGGVTMYRALKVSKAAPGEWVAIIGAGGGLGHMGIQFARKMGLNVVAIDSGDKEGVCTSSGASVFLDFKKTSDVAAGVRRITETGASAVLVCAGSRKAYEQAVDMLSDGGTIVCIALPGDPFHIPITPAKYLTRGLTVTGINASSVEDVEETLRFAAENGVRPKVQTFPLSRAKEALETMREQKTIGRVVLDLKSG